MIGEPRLEGVGAFIGWEVVVRLCVEPSNELAVVVDGGGWEVLDSVAELSVFELSFGESVDNDGVVVDEFFNGGREWCFGRADEHVRHDDEGFLIGDELREIGGGNVDESAFFSVEVTGELEALWVLIGGRWRDSAREEDAANGKDG